MSRMFVSIAFFGMRALVNPIPLSCSISRKFFTHLVLVSGGTESSHPVVSCTACRSSSFSLAFIGSSFPRASYRLALFDTIILLVNFAGTKASILARSPPFSKYSSATILPRQTLPKCKGGILISIRSGSVYHRIALTSIDTPSTVSWASGGAPLNE